ncbi:MAG: DUF58 domain-containing protein [Planctomycetaceae bacterium]|jgi:hypothetical protein|nr:DUF58 domain-containing protein [Planctomycetaceae bacterium]MCE2813176.1 DUF58 domain-containing protein [Planctomycetaceae bacterium]
MAILPLIAILLLFGILTGANFFALGASTFLITIQLAKFFSTRWVEAVEVERFVEAQEVTVGVTVGVGMKITNKSGYWIPWMLIDDKVAKRYTKLPPIALNLLVATVQLFSFSPKRTILHRYALQTQRRGYYQLGPTLLETGDLLGLHRSFRIANQPSYLTVLPKLTVLEGIEVSSRRPMGEMKVEDRVLEDPTLMTGLREYRAGDPINRVHWKATARTGTLHTRVFQPTCVQGAMLLLDMHESTNPQKHEPVRTDLAVSAAASIAHWLYQNAEPFGLVSNGRDAAERMRELNKKGLYSDRTAATANIEMRSQSDRLNPVVLGANRTPEHFAEMHRMLARLERTDGLKLDQLLIETESRLPKLLSLIAIVQRVDEAGLLALEMMRRRGYALTVMLNCHQDEYLDHAGKLIAARLPVVPLHDEESLREYLRQR